MDHEGSESFPFLFVKRISEGLIHLPGTGSSDSIQLFTGGV